MSRSGRDPGGDTLPGVPIDSLVSSPLQLGKAYLIVIRGRSVGRMVELTDQPTVIGRSLDCGLTVDDEAASRRHAQVTLTGGQYLLQDLGSTNGLHVGSQKVKEHVLRDGDRVQLGAGTIVKFSFQDAVEESFQRQLYESATRDPLLGIHNRQYFLDGLEAEFSLCYRSQLPLSVAMIDIDHFKGVNDRFGHLAGDAALKEVAGLIEGVLRTEDLLARYGGEEFSVLLRNTGREHSFRAVERVRQAVEAQVVEHDGNIFRVTVSVGVASLESRNHDSGESLLRMADRQLYVAKRQGRNRCVVAPLPSEVDEPESAVATRVRHQRTTRRVTVPLAGQPPVSDPGAGPGGEGQP